jgi:hypothetical protein
MLLLVLNRILTACNIFRQLYYIHYTQIIREVYT